MFVVPSAQPVGATLIFEGALLVVSHVFPFLPGKVRGEGGQVSRGGFKQVCAVPCSCDWPTNCSPGTLGKQSKPSPEIRGKYGKGICGSLWKWKWEQVWLSRWEGTSICPMQPWEAVM